MQHHIHGSIKNAARIVVLLLCIPITTQWTYAQTESSTNHKVVTVVNAEQEILNLSKKKWQWMSERNIDSLKNLFHEKAVFVHMSRTMSKEQELDIIKTGGIQYKKADIHEVSVNVIDNTAILLNSITLLAVVRGNEVTNPFVVTEVYVKENGSWKLGSLSFTKTVVPEPAKN